MNDEYVKTHLEMKYFVLKPSSNTIYGEASRKAMLAYARVIEEEAPDFSYELRQWINREEGEIRTAELKKKLDENPQTESEQE